MGAIKVVYLVTLSVLLLDIACVDARANKRADAHSDERSVISGNKRTDAHPDERSSTGGNKRADAHSDERSVTSGNKRLEAHSDEQSNTSSNESVDAQSDKRSGTSGNKRLDARSDERSNTSSNKSVDTQSDKRSGTGGTKRVDAHSDERPNASSNKRVDAQSDKESVASANKRADARSDENVDDKSSEHQDEKSSSDMKTELGDMILQQLDKTNEELASSADRRKDQVPKFLEKVNSWAQTLDDLQQMKQSLNRSLTFAEGKINAAYKEVKDKLCGHHKTVKGYLDLFPSADPEVAKLMTSSGKKGTQQGLVVKKLDELLNQLQGLLARYRRHMSPEEFEDPSTLDKWKAYFMRKSREAQATFSIEIDNIKESARSVLEALSNAIIISNNLKAAPKGGLELKNSKDKAAFLRMVSQLDTKLGCSVNQKK
nr:PREDICTED: uncharacterized protein LOC109035366 [Bemisia tabaci]